MSEVCRRMGAYLKLDDAQEIKIEGRLDLVENFVLPCVKKALDLKWDEQKVIRTTNKLTNKLYGSTMDLDEYIRQYIWWFYEKKIAD